MAENSRVYQEFATEKGPYAGIWIVVMILFIASNWLIQIILCDIY